MHARLGRKARALYRRPQVGRLQGVRPFSRSAAALAIALILAAGTLAFAMLRGGSGGDREHAAREVAEMRGGQRGRQASQPATTAPLCRSLRAMQAGRVADATLTELSGLVRSRVTRGSFWSIEDSGAGPVIHALGPRGEDYGALLLEGAANYDWEDLAIGPLRAGDGAGARSAYLYAADIGDNRRAREHVTIYRVLEPALPIADGRPAVASALRLTYPDGAHDAETLLVDPANGDVLIVTKGLTGGSIYRATPPAGFAGESRLRKLGRIGLTWMTGGSVSADGRTVAIRTYGSLSIWRRRGDEPLHRTLRRPRCTSPTALRDGQGEAIALGADGRTAWTVAERSGAPLLRLTPR